MAIAGDRLEHEILIAAPPEIVFAFFTDPELYSRWMGREAIPFFTPLRLRGTIYERFAANRWTPGRRDFTPLPNRDGTTQIARPAGFDRLATVQQRLVTGGRLLLPVGTWEIDGPSQIFEGPARDTFMIWQVRRDVVNYDVRLARSVAPLHVRRVAVTNYPVTPPVAAMARRIVGNAADPMAKAAAIEHYLSTRFRYIPNPADIGHWQVFLTDGNQYFNRPGPIVVESAEILAEIFHPAEFRFGHEGVGWERLDSGSKRSAK